MPHVYVILFAIMLLVTILSWIIPSGAFERDAANVVNPDNFQFIENETPIGVLDFFKSVYLGFVNGATVMGSLLICSGCLAILNHSKALEAGVNKLTEITHGKNFIAVLIFYVFFSGFNTMGASPADYPFYPIAAAIIVSLGYDRLMATGTILFAATAGFACGLVNLFTTGISQNIVGLPLFSGIGYRFIVFIVLFAIGLISILIYGARIKKDPNKSYIADEYKKQLAEQAKAKETASEEASIFTAQQKIALLLFIALIVLIVFGCLKLNFGLPECTAFYLMFAIILSVIFKIHPTELCQLFTNGMSQVLGAAFVIGLAQSVMVLLNQGKIMDTLVYYMGNSLQGKGPAITLLLIFLFVSGMNFLVTSGSAKAVMMVPILSPLGKMLNINQQVMILTYQLGDGLTNMLWPGGGLVACSLCGVDYAKWLKMSWKTFLAMLAAGYVLIVIANAIDYGPF